MLSCSGMFMDISWADCNTRAETEIQYDTIIHDALLCMCCLVLRLHCGIRTPWLQCDTATAHLALKLLWLKLGQECHGYVILHQSPAQSSNVREMRGEYRISIHIYIYIYMYIVNNEYMIYYMYTVYIYVFIDKLRKHSWEVSFNMTNQSCTQQEGRSWSIIFSYSDSGWFQAFSPHFSSLHCPSPNHPGPPAEASSLKLRIGIIGPNRWRVKVNVMSTVNYVKVDKFSLRSILFQNFRFEPIQLHEVCIFIELITILGKAWNQHI